MQKSKSKIDNILKDIWDNSDTNTRIHIRALQREVNEKAKLPAIRIPMTEEDCYDIIHGDTFDWCFDGIEVNIGLETKEEGQE